MISKARSAELVQILASSNKVAKKAATPLLGQRKYQVFRAVLRHDKNHTLNSSQVALINYLPQDVKDVIAQAEKVRDEVIIGFQSLVWKLARKTAWEAQGFEAADLTGEANLLLMKAIFGFSNKKKKMLQYFNKVIRSGLKRHTLQQRRNGLNSNSGEFVDLLRKVIDIEKDLQNEGKSPTFDAVYERLSIAFPECLDLKNKLLGIKGYVQTISDTKKNKEENDDLQVAISDQGLSYDLSDEEPYELFKLANLSDNETKVLVARMSGLSIKEISDVTQQDAGKIRVNLTTARRKLKRFVTYQLAAQEFMFPSI